MVHSDLLFEDIKSTPLGPLVSQLNMKLRSRVTFGN